jgi:hypothetical protein
LQKEGRTRRADLHKVIADLSTFLEPALGAAEGGVLLEAIWTEGRSGILPEGRNPCHLKATPCSIIQDGAAQIH